MRPGKNSQDENLTKSYSLASKLNSLNAKALGRIDTKEKSPTRKFAEFRNRSDPPP